MALELERPQPEQQLKPAMNPLLQGIYNLMGGGLEGALPNDPVIENLVKAGGFLKTQANDPLTYLGGGGVKTVAAYSPVWIAKQKSKINALVKRKEGSMRVAAGDPDEALEVTRLEKLITKAKNELAKGIKALDKSKASESSGKTTFPPSDKTLEKLSSKRDFDQPELPFKTKANPQNFDIDELATQIRRNEEAGTPFMFRGERGIASLSNKPTYLAADALDPRLPEFSKKSLKVLQPKFNKILDVDNMPSDIDQLLTNREMYRSRPSRAGGTNQMDFDIDRIRGNIRDSVNKTPSSINKETTDFFQKEGYDALRFPPRRFKGEGDTYISLDPLNNLSEFQNVSPDMVQDLIRELARNRMK